MSEQPLERSRILIVEDEETLAKGLEFNLKEEDYDVILAYDGKEALNLFNTEKLDLIILDIMLPYFNGFEIAEIIRKKEQQIPILFLTAKSSNDDKLKGLEIGADDYLTKPFHLAELILRVKGMLKRKNWYKQIKEENKVYLFGDNEINFAKYTCTNGNRVFQLTYNEIMVLKYLIDNRGKVISRKELLTNVWHVSPDVETRTVDIFISRLRKYCELDPSNPKHIISRRSAGYIFEE